MTPPTNVKLDGETQRALISWMVMRPDGPNNHLFPGTGMRGVEVATVHAAVAARPVQPAAPEAPVPPAESIPNLSEAEANLVEPGEVSEPAAEPPLPETAPLREAAAPGPGAPESARPAEAGQTGPVSLDEVETLRRKLPTTEVQPAPGGKPPVPPSVLRPVSARPRPAPEPAESRPVSMPVVPPLARPRGDVNVVRRPVPPRLVRDRQNVVGAGPAAGRGTPERGASRPAAPPPISAEGAPRAVSREDEHEAARQLPYRTLVVAGAVLAVVCCVGLAVAGGLTWRAGGVDSLIAGVTEPTATDTPEATATPAEPEASPTATEVRRASATPALTSTPAPTQTPSPSPIATDTPPGASAAEPASTATPIIVVVTATPPPEAPTATRRPSRTPARSSTEAPAETATEVLTPTEVLTSSFKYPAPVLLEPADHGAVQGKLCILKWEPVGPLADDEHYALRLIYLQQGQPVYQGDQLTTTDYRMPERFYYQADGPALEYKWFVFVERTNPDGSTTQLSPESETFVFRWD